MGDLKAVYGRGVPKNLGNEKCLVALEKRVYMGSKSYVD